MFSLTDRVPSLLLLLASIYLVMELVKQIFSKCLLKQIYVVLTMMCKNQMFSGWLDTDDMRCEYGAKNETFSGWLDTDDGASNCKARAGLEKGGG